MTYLRFFIQPKTPCVFDAIKMDGRFHPLMETAFFCRKKSAFRVSDAAFRDCRNIFCDLIISPRIALHKVKINRKK